MALQFDGSTVYIQRAATLEKIVDSKKGTISAWFKATSAPGNILLGINAGGNRVGLSIEAATGLLVFVLRDSTDTLLWSTKTATDYADDEWHHVGITWDLENNIGLLYVDRVADKVDSTAPTDGTVDYTGVTEWIIGANTGGTANFLDGGLFDIVFWPGVVLDFTDPDQLSFLVSQDGRTSTSQYYFQNAGPDPGPKPVGYGATASLYTDSIPAIFLSGSFTVNRGNGGAFTLNGDTAEIAGPPAYRSSALFPTPGERWFESERSGWSFPRSKTFIERREGIPAQGQRLGDSERDDTTRQENPTRTLSQLIFAIPGTEDDSEDDRRF